MPTPTLLPNHVLLRVLACGVCRTDLHIVEPTYRHVATGWNQPA